MFSLTGWESLATISSKPEMAFAAPDVVSSQQLKQQHYGGSIATTKHFSGVHVTSDISSAGFLNSNAKLEISQDSLKQQLI